MTGSRLQRTSVYKLTCFLLQLSCQVKTPISSQLVAVEMMLGSQRSSFSNGKHFKNHEPAGYGMSQSPQ